MIIKLDINSDLEIKSLQDLKKIKIMKESLDLKVNYTEIAKELNCDRRTVKKYVNGYSKPKKRNRKSVIDKYYNLMIDLLNSKTQLFRYKRILWQYLKDKHGLTCSFSTFRYYILKHEELNIYFLKQKKLGVSAGSKIRFETEPGEQAQLDWKESMKIKLLDGKEIEVNIFSLILGYSRFRVYRLSISKTQDVLFNFMDDAFKIFGGVPKEILTDNMRTVMDESRTRYFKGKVNNKFQQFADDYGFKVRPCIAASPYTKGKVESPMKILDELYSYSGIVTFSELVKILERINNRENSIYHNSYNRIPILYLEKEKGFLQPLPKNSIRNQYQIKNIRLKVSAQSLISYKSNQYSVPLNYIGSFVTLQVYDGMLHLYSKDKLIAIHSISTNRLNYLSKHYEDIMSSTFNPMYFDIKSISEENLKKIQGGNY